MDPVTLTEMMNARERRVSLQEQLIHTYHTPLVCLTLNIPGPVKVFGSIPQAFSAGCRRLEAMFSENAFAVRRRIITEEKTGYEAYYCVEADPLLLKRLCVTAEDQDSLGRLFDIDIITCSGSKISREELSLPARRCLLCQEPAHACSRSRRHEAGQLRNRIEEILKEEFPS